MYIELKEVSISTLLSWVSVMRNRYRTTLDLLSSIILSLLFFFFFSFTSPHSFDPWGSEQITDGNQRGDLSCCVQQRARFFFMWMGAGHHCCHFCQVLSPIRYINKTTTTTSSLSCWAMYRKRTMSTCFFPLPLKNPDDEMNARVRAWMCMC